MTHLEQWWASLTTEEKERIATKANNTEVPYPACTTWWLSIEGSRQEAIYRHCTDRHGLLLPEYREDYIHGYLNDR